MSKEKANVLIFTIKHISIAIKTFSYKKTGHKITDHYYKKYIIVFIVYNIHKYLYTVRLGTLTYRISPVRYSYIVGRKHAVVVIQCDGTSTRVTTPPDIFVFVTSDLTG